MALSVVSPTITVAPCPACTRGPPPPREVWASLMAAQMAITPVTGLAIPAIWLPIPRSVTTDTMISPAVRSIPPTVVDQSIPWPGVPLLPVTDPPPLFSDDMPVPRGTRRRCPGRPVSGSARRR
ncbi:conserved hypothetical protein [Streptomyces clavuligerus]|uniref:Uncharacterized protein n=1 Tax=Streptomyces clavuligerus TaxID=1901 RepID=Q6TMS0_STRCL|nr:hypothetical protein pSCL2.5.424.13c [Streptomyces clavuligerus]EDY48747.1 conserved hypothetical protein [Streptomyces clavuligerus]